LVALSGAGFGAQSILAKVAYDGGADVSTVLAVRFAVATLVIWAVLGVRPWGAIRGIARGRWLGFAALGLLFVVSALLAYSALERLPAGTTTLLVFVFPALVVLWSRLLFGERLTSRRGAALALALTGCALTVAPGGAFADGEGLSGLGVALALGSALSNSWYATLAGPITRGVPGLVVAAGSLPVTALCFLAVLVFRGGPPAAVTAGGWAASAGIGLLVAASTTAFLAGVARIGSTRAAIAATSEPATAVVLGVLLLGEPLTALGLVGGLCIGAAIVLLAVAPSRAEGASLTETGGACGRTSVA
jgi:drug/metabolite transporter (DMT)-like permease